MKILITGGNGNLVTEFKKIPSNHHIIYASKQILDVAYFESIENFVDTYGSFDLVIGNAYIYQPPEMPIDNKIFDMTYGHAKLAKLVEAKHFINFTTPLIGFDKHYPYRSVKTFIEDYYYRFFKWEMPELIFHNIHPGHLDDKVWLPKAALLLNQYINNIGNYHKINYTFDNKNLIKEDENKTLRR